jgi:hypothetical protein
MRNTLVISCHSDTGFRSHRLRIDQNGDYFGHLDNFVGVYTVMKAYFSGELDYPNVRIELTYGEETDMEGAYQVLETLDEDDVVIVVDVTGALSPADITIEKCSDPWMKKFVTGALEGLAFELYEDCPDPVASEDESDVYRQRLRKVCFLGIPSLGGDYNREMVTAPRKSVETAARALIRLAKAFSEGASGEGN